MRRERIVSDDLVLGLSGRKVVNPVERLLHGIEPGQDGDNRKGICKERPYEGGEGQDRLR